MTEAKQKVNLSVDNKDNNLLSIFTTGIIKENSIFAMALGLCPALAISQTFESAFGMSLLVVIVLILTNATISALRNFIPGAVRLPAYIIIIATEVTVINMFVDAFALDLSQALGVFIPLITVNCIVLGRAESFASKNSVGKSIIDGAGTALGYGIALSLIGFFRELIGTGMIKIGVLLPLPFEFILFENWGLSKYALGIFSQPPGAFLVMGIMIAVIAVYKNMRAQGGKK
ncbi:MAG: electron transport complex subunit RsxE [Acholeplasmataceae bacterium]